MDPLELVAFDLWEPSRVQSGGGKLYFMPIVDAGTSYKHGAYLCDKSDASTISAFDLFRVKAESMTRKKIHRLVWIELLNPIPGKNIANDTESSINSLPPTHLHRMVWLNRPSVRPWMMYVPYCMILGLDTHSGLRLLLILSKPATLSLLAVTQVRSLWNRFQEKGRTCLTFVPLGPNAGQRYLS